MGSLSSELNIVLHHKRQFSGRVALLPGAELSLLVSINVNKTRKPFSRNIHATRMLRQCFPLSHMGNRSKLCLRYTAGNFNENPSIRAVENIFQARASQHLSNFCEQFEQTPNFASTFKLYGTIPYP